MSDVVKKLTLRSGDTAFYQYDSLLGFWGIPNIERDVLFSSMNDSYVNVRHNQEGNRDKSVFRRDKSRKTVLCLGGSHTWGAGVEQDSRYTSRLEELIQAGQVFNLGHCSVGLDQICLIVLNRSEAYKPDVIVVEQYPWAIHRVLNTYVNGYTRPYFHLDEVGALKLQKMSPLSRFKICRRIIGSFHTFRKELREFKAGIRLDQGYDPWADPIFLCWKIPYYDYMYSLVDRILAVMQDFCRQKGIHLLFGLEAIMQQIHRKSPSALVDYELPNKRLKTLLEKNRIAYVDTSPTMMEENRSNDPVVFADGHMNDKGHRIFAAELYQAMEKRGWLR
jgi:hypothetical protein